MKLQQQGMNKTIFVQLSLAGRKKPSAACHHVVIHPGGGGKNSDMKQTGMLVVSLRGVNFGFWSRLGCSGQGAKILSRQGLVYGSAKNLRFMTMLLKTTFR